MSLTSSTIPSPERRVRTVTGVARVTLDTGAPIEAHLVGTLAHTALWHPIGNFFSVYKAPQVLEDTINPQASHAAHVTIPVLNTSTCCQNLTNTVIVPYMIS